MFLCFRGIVNDTYKMDLILVHPPYRIALACIYIASVHTEKDITAWFEDLHEDMNLVSHTYKSVAFIQLTVQLKAVPLCGLLTIVIETFAGEEHCHGDSGLLRKLQINHGGESELRVQQTGFEAVVAAAENILYLSLI